MLVQVAQVSFINFLVLITFVLSTLELSWKLMMSEIINAFSIEFIKREKDKMELLLQDISAQTIANRSTFGGILVC